ncbi:MAG: UDP-2,3-diacylglucosamine diphosphatase [Gammaproteobacteria bacterium RIFCSPHIGHO2_12_FULL_37_14]|nr:MAG: UDP-2,3-diacylglucosamine diphosphatase [Gammaproteobacteria bacterium RIFCSPHIGHO2_12_FULL_37_14]
MHPQRKTLFLSDLHLEEIHPDISQQFIQLMKNCDSSIDAIYILGDLFEAWIGDDDNTPFHQTIIDSLTFVTKKGIPVYFMRGNRDFLIGKKFLRATGCQLLSNEKEILLYGERILLMHGDTLCTKDIAYLKWRKKARNPILHTLFFLILPLSIRRRFANKMRLKSAQYTQSASSNIMDVSPEEVIRVMQKYKVQILIHGHTHRPHIHHLIVNELPATRVVLAAWHHRGSVLVYDDSGKYYVSYLGGENPP